MVDFITTNKLQVDELIKYMEENNSKKDFLIMILHKAQDIFGYLSKEILILISEKLGIPLAEIYGVVTFYSYFNTEKKGKYSISVCLGTACFVKGAEDILKEFMSELKIGMNETTEDNLFTIESIRCFGACGLAPIVSINGKIYGEVKVADVKSIINEYRSKESSNNG